MHAVSCHGTCCGRYRTRGFRVVSHLREAGTKLWDRLLGASCKFVSGCVHKSQNYLNKHFDLTAFEPHGSAE